ncbi:amidase [Antrihabitans cavernicola]|uniref:amidase n=1 Tax=Antrihabitans cavernicola TaxID=2495913 RepID=A0A5A7SEX1_9NOCA|nr:amidase family protein [Spelaeibacter cavernicola]KAA0024396.1 amidase [Spelaeibacter cavernicola]
MLSDAQFTATSIADRVRSGTLSPVDAVRASLDRIDKRDARIGAFALVRSDKALAEAEALSARTDLADLPLAGVPIAVKDNVAVAGEPMRSGSAATSATPATADHAVVARLRAAGAVVVGITTMPELGVWSATDGPNRITRNPWNLDRTCGGSSGGAGAAVAAGMVPVAQGNDGLGSIRIPSASCGIFGIKPGKDLVPADIGKNSWFDMAENGPMATTVADAALMLSVLADNPDFAQIADPDKLRIGLAVGAPKRGSGADRHWTAAARKAGSVMVSAGHLVETATLPYPSLLPVLFRWTASTSLDSKGLDRSKLEKRNRRHSAIGRVVGGIGLIGPVQVEKVQAELRVFFENLDLVITPTLARMPPKAKAWSEASWASNIVTSARFAPFAPLWNLVGWPAASVPIGTHPKSGTPMAVQIAGPPGSEAKILALAAQLEVRRPWVRIAPNV